MTAPYFPFGRTRRRSGMLSGDGSRVEWGPSAFKVTDVADVEVWVKLSGEDEFSLFTGVTIEKTGAGFSTFTVTFDSPPAASTHFYYQGRRLHERSVGITKGSQLDREALDLELTKIGFIQQEHYRELEDLKGLYQAALELVDEAIEVSEGINSGPISAASDATAGADKLVALQSPGLLRLISLPYIPMDGLKGSTVLGVGGPAAWLQWAIWDGQERNKPVFIAPSSTSYDFGEDAFEVAPGDGNIRIYGQPGHSVISLFEGTDAEPKSLFYDTGKSSSKGWIEIEGLTIRGTFATRTEQGRPAIFLDHYKMVKLHNNRFEQLTMMATDLHFCEDVEYVGNRFVDIPRDCARARETKYVLVTGNYFRRIGDDCVALHGGAYTETAYDPDDGSPRREGLIVTNNFFRDTTACVTMLGARQATVEANHANRFQAYFCYINNTPGTEGAHPASNIKIRGNTALNCIGDTFGGGGLYVYVQADDPRGSTATSSVVPGMPHGDGSFENIWDHQLADSFNSGDAFPPLENVDISANTFDRTLPLVANYSDWGFGKPGRRTHGQDLAVTEAMMRVNVGITSAVGLVTKISGNTVKHTKSAIAVVAQPDLAPMMKSADVAGNTLYDFTERGIWGAGSISGKLIDLMLTANHLDGDVKRKSGNSNLDGSYDGGFTFPRAFDLSDAYGASIGGNRISNVAEIAPNLERHVSYDNTLICDPVAFGYNAGNKGIGNLPTPHAGFRYIVADCDPTSETYGTIKNIMLQFSNSVPTSGTYIRGWMVMNGNPTVQGSSGSQYIVTSWTRLTTGDAHVVGTDWVANRVPTGT